MSLSVAAAVLYRKSDNYFHFLSVMMYSRE